MLVMWDKMKNVHLYQFWSGRVLVIMHPFLYKKVKIMFPNDIGGLSENSTI